MHIGELTNVEMICVSPLKKSKFVQNTRSQRHWRDALMELSQLYRTASWPHGFWPLWPLKRIETSQKSQEISPVCLGTLPRALTFDTGSHFRQVSPEILA